MPIHLSKPLPRWQGSSLEKGALGELDKSDSERIASLVEVYILSIIHGDKKVTSNHIQKRSRSTGCLGFARRSSRSSQVMRPPGPSAVRRRPPDKESCSTQKKLLNIAIAAGEM